MSFPNLPAEYEDPWYTKFINWATSVQNRITGTETVANAAATKSYADGIKTTADAALPVKGVLGDISLDTIVTPGIYFLQNSAYATLANGYPIAGGSWSIKVLPSNTAAGTGVLQKVTSVWDSVNGARGVFQRYRKAPTDPWEPWRFLPSQRVDATAGRAIYTWDHLNNREQLIYGDTGRRDISALLINGWAGSLFIRRQGYTVTLECEGLNGSAATADAFLSNIVGFTAQGSVRGLLHTAAATPTLKRVSEASGNLAVAGSTTTAHYGVVTWNTSQAWPTTLPGIASGTTPNV
jgi:hypothetical protein